MKSKKKRKSKKTPNYCKKKKRKKGVRREMPVETPSALQSSDSSRRFSPFNFCRKHRHTQPEQNERKKEERKSKLE